MMSSIIKAGNDTATCSRDFDLILLKGKQYGGGGQRMEPVSWHGSLGQTSSLHYYYLAFVILMYPNISS
jgi:hypothetical protein